MYRQLAFLLLSALQLAALGCSPAIHRPDFAHPGPAAYQRYNATQWDPYPQNDVGPEIVGGRPPDFIVPPNELERARQHNPYGPYQSAPAPAFPPVFPAPQPVPAGPLY